MSPYAQTLAQARLDALQALQQALQAAETPNEKRRCAVAIFNAPDPRDLDDSIEWADDNNFEEDQNRATGSPALRGQPVPDATSPEAASPEVVSCEPVPPAAGAVPAAGACCNLGENPTVSQIERLALAACPPVAAHWGHNDHLQRPPHDPPPPDISPPPCAPTG